MFRFIVLLFVIVLLNISIITIESKKKKSNNNKEDEEVIEFTSEEDLNEKLKELNSNKDRKLYGDELSLEELNELKKEETKLQKNVLRAALNHGDFSKEKANALHMYGRNLYKQGKYEEVLSISKDIVKIHEEVDGYEDINTGNALGNVASVAFRLNMKEVCQLVLLRSLYIMIKHFGKDSKEELFHRGKMLTFQVPNAETTKGLSYEQYLEEIEERGLEDEL